MTPAESLERIAYLLELQGAETYRVRAFRRAADTVASRDPDELAALDAKGQLATLPGIGPKTATVVSQVLRSGTSAYLEGLEMEVAEAEIAEAPGVEELLAALVGDCHTHTDWSDGGSPMEAMVAAGIDLDHRWMVVTDHSPRLKIANGLSAERLRSQLELIETLNARVAPFRILTGIEVDILDDGGLDQEPKLLERLDVVVASVHSKLRMEARDMTRRMVAAVSNPLVDILGHCTGRIVVGRGRPQSRFDAEAVFGACAAAGTAVEINSRPERLDPPQELLAVAAEAGCMFSIDTDAHAPGQLAWQVNGVRKAVKAGIGAERILTCFEVDHLLEWTERGNPEPSSRGLRPRPIRRA